MPTAVTEKQVLEIWQSSLQGRTDLTTVANEPVRVVYPGRRNDDRGADFKDAVITTRGRQLKGDIEIHVKASNWWTHQHHRDPAYNRVILHVVYQNDTLKTIVLENGFIVPTLALFDYVERNDTAASPPIPCRGAGYHENAGLIARMLDEAGEARFLIRAAHFRESITQDGVGQALYQGIMTALGYSKNKEAMTELAYRMPLSQLEALASDEVPDSEYLAESQARLMGMAGMLPSQRAELYPPDKPVEGWEEKLENIWAACGVGGCMSPNSWHLFKVRPGNHPVRRVAAMTYLLLRYREKGLLAGVEDRLKEVTADDGVHSLEQALIIAPDSYWDRYLDFRITAGGAAPALLGKERAADTIVNVLLPFAFARGPAKQGKEVLNIYRGYRAPEENTLVRHMRQQLGLERCLINTARRQQGLIHIYKTLCLEGNCYKCPLGNKLA